jgi:hypothetical protein
MTRAIRRHHRQRMRERNRRNYPGWPDAWKFGDTRAIRSDFYCRRKWNGPRIQERRELQTQE